MRLDYTFNGNGPAIRIRTKLWLELDGELLIGEGRARLLRLIQDKKSINSAAKAMGLTFRRAWSMIKEMEDTLKIKLVARKRGGFGGGTTTLTLIAVELLEQYEKVHAEFNEFVSN